jgi:lipooligosaccharide transport system ATP-binding protein
MNIVTANGLTKDYNSLRAVNNIDFEIRKGECFGFLGPNGAGKTTVMSVIYCFIPPSGGCVKVFDLDVMNMPGKIKSRIGVMPQDNNLDPDITVLENLIVYARYFNIIKKESLPRAWKLLDFVALRDKADINIQDLSGGMKRRLLLARSLMNNPELLMLDEPTTGLDPHSRHSVWEQLSLLKSKGISLILTTHYMEEAEKLCDRVAIMDSGKIVSIGTPADLMNKYNGNLENVYMQLTGKNLKG